MEKLKSFWGIAVLMLLLVGAAIILSNAGGAVALGGTGFNGVTSILSGFTGFLGKGGATKYTPSTATSAGSVSVG